MQQIPCPLNGLRPQDEFICGGIIRPMPAADADDIAWRDYLFFAYNLPGEVWEWWCHTPSGFWFAARRNTQTDEFGETMTVEKAQQLFGGGQ